MKILNKNKINNLELKNSIVFPAIGTNLANPDGSLNEEILNHYESIAKGGAGLLITEITKIENETGQSMSNQLSAVSMEDIAKLKPLPEMVHKYGAKIFLQLQHPGFQCNEKFLNGKLPLSPSKYKLKDGTYSKEMTTREIQVLINKFSMAARIAEESGFDGVELHAAHGYLLSQFLSPDTNKRMDEYGGNIFTRTTIITKIIEGIKQFCSQDFIISVRINGDDFLDNGLNLSDAIIVAKILETSGINVINVSSGTSRSLKSSMTIIEPKTFEQGWKKNLAKEIKSNVNIPVIACSNIKDPEIAESLLDENICDFVAIGRGQIADYNFVNKCISKDFQSIDKCISCLACIKQLMQDKPIKCVINEKLK